MKKIVTIMLMVVLAFGLTACGGTEPADKETAELLAENYGIKTPMSIPKNNINNWIMFEIQDTRANNPSKYAVDLVKAYKTRNDEEVGLIWVINFANNTTTSFTTTSPIIVIQHDRVEKEELDCKTIGKGTELAEYIIDFETGEVFE